MTLSNYNTNNFTFDQTKTEAALILLDRLKTCEPIDTFHMIVALKELLNDDPTNITYEDDIQIEPDEVDTVKRHWKPV